MTEEILKHFPIGSDTSFVVKEMQQNKFEAYIFYDSDLWVESRIRYRSVNYLTFRRTKSTSFWISTTWIIRMMFDEQGQITEVIVEVGYTGP